MKKVTNFFSVLLLTGCVAFSGEKQINGIIVTQQIFPDGNISSVLLRMDNIVDNLKIVTMQEIEASGLTIVSDPSNADALLKVKTLFSGKIPTSKIEEIVKEDLNVYDVEGLKHRVERKEVSQTKIDKLIEDPSGMLIGFAVGISMSNPMVAAPMGMAFGAGLNLAASTFFGEEENLTVLEVEVHEKAKKPLWYIDKRIHKKDENSIRKYEFSEETNRKVYKTRLIVHGKKDINEIAKRLASFVI